ncbi:acyl-CoA dehydrogenase family member 10-like isoform X1 [Corticium candelabrum]|uniref:acyl-CoA dehydrogenase family member 10-like isoform X1 n=1 Tax=Corticium candelabrum TaxID=121492 RepID=UPI002E26A742|nr:acyl-CoA dehydrogenase family member 10-like isoform X1 [Corticium candelabrum]
MDKLIAWLPEHLPQKDRTTLVHGDYRLDNLIFSTDSGDPKVVAVLDWELSTLGDPLSDLAYNCMGYHLGPGFPALQGLAGEDLESLGIPTEEQYVGDYCRQMGFDSIEDWQYYLTFSFFRAAAILQGVYKRATQGQASAANAEAVGMMTQYIADLGWRFAEKSQTQKSKL